MAEARAVVTWCWPGPRGYKPKRVNHLAAQCKRHSPDITFVCVYEGQDPGAFSADVCAVPMPPEAHAAAHLTSPEGPGFPSSYRRLAALSGWGRCLADTILVLDVDCFVCAPLEPYFERPEPFVGWRPRSVWGREGRIAGGTWFHRTGRLEGVWRRFSQNMLGTIREAKREGYRGSDQAVLSYLMGPDVPVFEEPNGIYQGQDHNRRDWRVPADARIIHFNGNAKPWKLLHLNWVKQLYAQT